MEPQPSPTDGGRATAPDRPPETTPAPTLEEAGEPVPTTVVDASGPVEPSGALGPSAPRVRRGLGNVGYALAALGGILVAAAVFIGSGAASVGGPAPSPAPTFAVGDAVVGVATAPVTIQIWADYQCPYCGLFTHGVEPTIVRDYAATGRALVEFKDFAFLGQESTDAAVAAACAGRQGSFWTYHDLVFASQSGENQGAFVRQNLVSLAAFAGLDATTFQPCLDDATIAAAVAAETEEGRGLGIESTPTLRISGPGGTKLLKGVTQPSAIAAAVDAVSKPPASPGASSGNGAAPSPSDGPESTATPGPTASNP